MSPAYKNLRSDHAGDYLMGRQIFNLKNISIEKPIYYLPGRLSLQYQCFRTIISGISMLRTIISGISMFRDYYLCNINFPISLSIQYRFSNLYNIAYLIFMSFILYFSFEKIEDGKAQER